MQCSHVDVSIMPLAPPSSPSSPTPANSTPLSLPFSLISFSYPLPLDPPLFPLLVLFLFPILFLLFHLLPLSLCLFLFRFSFFVLFDFLLFSYFLDCKAEKQRMYLSICIYQNHNCGTRLIRSISNADICFCRSQVLRRTGTEEKVLVLVKRRQEHQCKTSVVVAAIVLWDGLSKDRADLIYREAKEVVPQHAMPTYRRCGINEK